METFLKKPYEAPAMEVVALKVNSCILEVSGDRSVYQGYEI